MSRFSRQIILPQVGAHGQSLLEDAHVGIIGLGGLGSAAALYLGAAGIGRLSLVDHDRVELSNLQRQIIHNEERVGQNKAESAAQSLRALNTGLQLDVHACKADEYLLDSLAQDCDVLLDCSDNFPTRHAVNRACVQHHCPLISGAAIRWEGQLMVLHPGQANSPCYACLFAEAGEATESCENAGVIGPLVGTIGSMQALETIKFLLGQSQVGNMLMLDAQTLNWRKWQINPDPSCAVCADY